MGSNTIPTATDGTIIPASNHNAIKSALSNNHVPRNTSGIATALGGTLGESSLEWLKAFIASGYWSPGDIKAHHSYNGSVGPGQGWMLCDGRVINEANYNTEHGAGSWAIYIGSSPLDGKYLPPAGFIAGVTATAQDGSAPITKIGADTINTPIHNHKWMDFTSPSLTTTFDANGNQLTIPQTGASGYWGTLANDYINGDMWTNNNGSASQENRPSAVEYQIYMRII